MDFRDQVLQFKRLLENNDLDADDFELNVDSDVFRNLLGGGTGNLEVVYRKSGMTLAYQYDGTTSWLDLLTNDLESGKFLASA